jgi:hypothetical protein
VPELKFLSVGYHEVGPFIADTVASLPSV